MTYLSRTNRTGRRAVSRLRTASLVAAPVLALSVACGGGAATKDGGIADAPPAPTVPAADGGAGTGKDAVKDGARAPAAGKSAFYDAQVKFVQCMRAKGGYKEFPDPKLSGHLDWARIGELGAQPGRNEGIKAGRDNVCLPELQAAMDAEPPRDQQKSYESMLAHAKCMRDNGIPKFTNPTMSGGNAVPGGDPSPGSPAIDTGSPAYKQAREACRTKLLDGLDGMQ
ncbi:hypothetical protein ACQPZG_15645 [Streptomyces sp. CA-294286]|uniref:hypothetical protein n=1 Tax=Streptomyces sp. CA-294286 TaxID=3240070 RepID=UPI003D8CC0A5